MPSRLRAAALAAAAILCISGTASAEVYQIDPAHSAVSFKIKHFFTMVPGRFKTFSGAIDYDPQSPEKATVEVTIEAASITTDNEKRDADLRGENFFWVEKHPTITFKSTKVTKKGENQLDVAGDLTIRGITKPVTLAVEVLGTAPGLAGFHGTTTINRLEYDVKWNRTLDNGSLMLGNDVLIELPVEARAKRG